MCDRGCYGKTNIKIGRIQARLAWPLRNDDTQIREGSIFSAISSDQDTPSPYRQGVGLRVELCLLAQVTSSQDLLQTSLASAW